MIRQSYFIWLLLLASTFTLTGCGDAETTIIEKDPIAEESDEHEDEHEHDHEAHGRLAVLNASSAEALVYNLEDNSLLASFALETMPSALHASANYRYALLVDRDGDSVRFLDGGLWQEDHIDHFDEYEEAPVVLDYSLSASKPTHVDTYEGQLAVFFDGDAESATPASILVLSDEDIAAANAMPATINFNTSMHGVAKPRGEHILASWRRDDAESTSVNPILPDQVAVYHFHGDQFEQEQILDVNCPDLHGAAQNESYIAFGCADGVLLAHADGDHYEAEKIGNSDEFADGLRVGSIYAHEDIEQFIAVASAHGGASVQFFSISPTEAEMELIDWEPVENASVVARGFAFEGEQFLILDNQGYLSILEAHDENGHAHWELSARIDISEENVANMPEGMHFSLSVAKNEHLAYVGDPLAQHIVIVDLELMGIDGEIELNFPPSAITWLGIAEAHED